MGGAGVRDGAYGDSWLGWQGGPAMPGGGNAVRRRPGPNHPTVEWLELA